MFFDNSIRVYNTIFCDYFLPLFLSSSHPYQPPPPYLLFSQIDEFGFVLRPTV